MKLSKHFSYEDLTYTSYDIGNHPEGELPIQKMTYLGYYLLDPIKEQYPNMAISSAFRSPELNTLLKSHEKSQHLLGEAADIVIPRNTEEAYIWMKFHLTYGQLILERHNNKEWIHISLPRYGTQNMKAWKWNR